MIKEVYRKLTPEWAKRKMAISLDDDDKKQLRKDIISFLKSIPKNKITSEQKEVLKFLKGHYLGVFPYKFRYDYRAEEVEIEFDKEKDLFYVIEDGNRLYHKRSWNEEKIRKAYNFLRMEQDILSPHRYLTHDFNVEEGDVVVDVGVAEGNFALSIIEKVSKIYLFETDPEWIEALQATFEKWAEKVVIINKFVSNVNDDSNVTLDNFFEKNGEIDFIKIDVDGAESKLLSGADNLLSNEIPKKVAICTYHRQQDAKEFDQLLNEKGFINRFSDGYMLFIYDPEIKAPYLRKGLIRAIKK